MDHIDEQLLRMLSENARIPLKEMAERVYLSSPATAARIASLKKQGIIKGYHTEIDWLKLGYHITAFINLEVAPQQKKVFYPFIKACPNVMECNCVTGNYSMLIKVRFCSTMDLDVFIGEVQKFGKTSTQIVFSTVVEHRGLQIFGNEAKDYGIDGENYDTHN